MIPQRSQADYPPEKHSRFSRHGRRKQRIQDHAQWSANLTKRRILGQAIAVGAWIEYSDYYGRYSLVWHEKRRDGSRGARRRRFIDPPVINGKTLGKSIWFPGEKTDEPFHYLVSIHDLKQAIVDADAELNIVEGEIDVWSMHALGIRNVIGIYGITNIPKDIAAILDALGVTRIVYFADNDTGGEKGGANLRTLLHNASWRGESEYRNIAGPGIPQKGDANDLLCHYYPDISAARAALAALPRFEPRIKRAPRQKPVTRINSDLRGWDAVNEAITGALGLHATDFKPTGFTKKNFHCLNPQHEDTKESAGWSRTGSYNCFYCGKIHSWQIAEWLNIDWRALLRPQQQPVFSDKINLDAAPQAAPEQPDWQRDDLPPLIMPYPTPSPQDAPSRCVAGLHIERYQRVTDIPAEVWSHEVIALRAQQGGGKTYALYAMAQAAMRAGKRVLWLAPNISQTERARTQLPDAIHYAELQRRRDIVTATSAITTWKSLHHFRRPDGSVSEFDLIIADEVHLALPQLTGQIFRNDEALVTIQTAQALLSAAGQLIAASADMTDLEVEWLHELSGQRVYIIDNPHTSPLPPVTEFHNQYRMLDDALTLAATADAPVFIGLGSKAQARALKELALSRGLSNEDIALVTADTQRERPAIRELVADPDTHCGRYRLILYTSAISEGFSYSGPCAGSFVTASNPALTPVRYSQMTHRARQAKRYAFAPIYSLNDNRLTDADAILDAQLARHRDNGFTVSPELLKFARWASLHMAQKNAMRQDPSALLRQLLLNQGHASIETDSRPSDPAFVEAVKAARGLVSERDAQSTIFTPVRSSKIYREKLLQGAATADDRQGRDRDRIEMDTGQYLNRELYDRYRRRRDRSKLDSFRLLLAPEEESVRLDREEEQRGLPLHRRGNYALRWRLELAQLRALAHEAGINPDLPTFELLNAMRGQTLYKDQIETATAAAIVEHPEWRTYGRSDANIRSTSENYYICAKNILARGGVKLARTEERATNPRTSKREYLYHICPEALDRRLDDLEHLLIHRVTQIRDDTEPERNPLRLARLAEERALQRSLVRDKPTAEEWSVAKAAGQVAFDAAVAQSCNLISFELQVCATEVSEYERWRAQIEAIPI